VAAHAAAVVGHVQANGLGTIGIEANEDPVGTGVDTVIYKVRNRRLERVVSAKALDHPWVWFKDFAFKDIAHTITLRLQIWIFVGVQKALSPADHPHPEKELPA
jgi:hypothetical protein